MFTYLIGWSNLDRYYYGCRYSKKSNPEQLWTKYFTSSKVVKKMREKYGEPDIIKIRRIFSDKIKCIEWEHKVLRRLNAANSVRWLNITNGTLMASGKHRIVVKDAITGILIGTVDEDNELYKSGQYVFHLKGVKNEKKSIGKGVPREFMKGKVTVLNQITNEWFLLNKNDDRIKNENLVSYYSIYCSAIVAETNKIINVKRDDVRFSTGEIKHISSGMVPVKYANNHTIRLSVPKDDGRLLTGELIHVRKGLKSKNPQHASRKKEKNGMWTGISDDEYFELLVKNINENDNTLRWNQLAKLIKLPKSRYHIRSRIEEIYSLPTYR